MSLARGQLFRRLGALSGAAAVGAAAYGAHALRNGQPVPLSPQPGAAGCPPLPVPDGGWDHPLLRHGDVLWDLLLPCPDRRFHFHQNGTRWRNPPDPWLGCYGSLTPPTMKG
ncbi:transmembrane protein 256 isoform X2 [Sphaerodactylus townsendi]|uniref:transmembrane protein 256 isoform X2 n=1 Tax=Sphaerodactylus townsendi TaxID=933632 RepID=UPI0020260A80|nr:transmembrane protein 256 isoform X2 [Sphaerodactylus townsendi]